MTFACLDSYLLEGQFINIVSLIGKNTVIAELDGDLTDRFTLTSHFDDDFILNGDSLDKFTLDGEI